MAIAAVFDSWTNRRAIDYRRLNGIPDDIYTAVTVQSMVFGNTGRIREPGSPSPAIPQRGRPIMYGEFLSDAQGEDVVAGIRTPDPIASLEHAMPGVYNQLREIADRLEITIETCRTWNSRSSTASCGCCRPEVASGPAALPSGWQSTWNANGLITREDAVNRVTADRLEELLHPIVMAGVDDEVIATGLPASPGGASGVVVFDADEAEEMAASGESVVLVRHETSPDDFHGMVAAVCHCHQSRGCHFARGRRCSRNGKVLCRRL